MWTYYFSVLTIYFHDNYQIQSKAILHSPRRHGKTLSWNVSQKKQKRSGAARRGEDAEVKSRCLNVLMQNIDARNFIGVEAYMRDKTYSIIY